MASVKTYAAGTATKHHVQILVWPTPSFLHELYIEVTVSSSECIRNVGLSRHLNMLSSDLTFPGSWLPQRLCLWHIGLRRQSQAVAIVRAVPLHALQQHLAAARVPRDVQQELILKVRPETRHTACSELSRFTAFCAALNHILVSRRDLGRRFPADFQQQLVSLLQQFEIRGICSKHPSIDAVVRSGT